jgi:hypothetical protein
VQLIMTMRNEDVLRRGHGAGICSINNEVVPRLGPVNEEVIPRRYHPFTIYYSDVIYVTPRASCF